MSFTLRPATIDDALSLAQVHVEGWRAAYYGVVDHDFLSALSVATRADDWRRWLAEDKDMQVLIAEDAHGAVAGFVSFGRLRTAIPGQSPIRPLYTAEIYALYLLPAYWRQGLGAKLLGAAAQALQGQRHKSLCLWVLEKNERAVSFYKAKGGERCGKKDVEIGARKLREVCFGWRALTPLLQQS